MKRVIFLIVLLLVFMPRVCALDEECEVTNSYSVNYVTNGGSISTNKIVISMDNESTTFKMITPTKSGYKFLGWYYDEEFNEKASFDTIGDINNDYFIKISSTECTDYYELKLYAKWELSCPKVSYTHHIVFDTTVDGLSKIGISDNKEEQINLPKISKDGYKFIGWYYDSNYKTKAEIEKVSDIKDKYYKKVSSTECNDYYELKLYAGFVEETTETIKEEEKVPEKEKEVTEKEVKENTEEKKKIVVLPFIIGFALLSAVIMKYKVKGIK